MSGEPIQKKKKEVLTVRLIPPMLSSAAKTVPMPLQDGLYPRFRSRKDDTLFLDLMNTGDDRFRYQAEANVRGPPFGGFDLSVHFFSKDEARDKYKAEYRDRPKGKVQRMSINPGTYTIESPTFVEHLPGRERKTKYSMSFNVTKDARIEILDDAGNVARALDMKNDFDREQGLAILTAYAVSPTGKGMKTKTKLALQSIFSLIRQQGQMYKINATKAGSEKQFNELVGAKGITLVKFEADWCGPCKKLGVTMAEMAEKRPDLRFLALDVTEAYKTIDEEDHGGWGGDLLFTLHNRIPGKEDEEPPLPVTVIYMDGQPVAGFRGVPKAADILRVVRSPSKNERLR